MRLLIIEDEKRLSAVLKKGFTEQGFAVDQAFDGEEGLSLLQQNKPDLILLDLIMPKKSGFEVLEAISMDPELNKIPVMIASNLGQDSDIQKAKSLGAIEYYVKVRTSIDELAKLVKNVIQRPAGSTAASVVPAQPAT